MIHSANKKSVFVQARVLLFYLCLYLLLIVLLGPTHNPDANLYYAVTIRILSGNFASSVDGLIGPLLSWLMTVPAYLGASLPASFQIVQFFCFVLLACDIFAILKLMRFSERTVFLMFLPLFCQVGIISQLVVTSDLLFASLMGAALALRIYAHRSRFHWGLFGILGGFAYLSRAIGFPIFLGWVAVEFIRAIWCNDRRFAGQLCLSVIVFFMVSLPWIWCLTHSYGVLNIGTNHFFSSGLLSENDYYVGYPLKEKILALSGRDEVIKQGFFTALNQRYFLNSLYHIYHSLNWLLLSDSYLVAGPLFFAAILAGFAVSAFRLLKSGQQYTVYRSLLLYIAVYFLIYAALGGHRLRYYFGIVPLLGVFILAALQEKSLSPEPQTSLMPLRRFLCLLFLGAACLPPLLLPWHFRQQLLLAEELVNTPAITSSGGALAGNYWDDTAGFTAALTRREYRYSVRPELNETTEQIEAKLVERDVEQILWVGETLPALDELTKFKKKNCGLVNSTLQCTIYDRQDSGS